MSMMNELDSWTPEEATFAPELGAPAPEAAREAPEGSTSETLDDAAVVG